MNASETGYGDSDASIRMIRVRMYQLLSIRHDSSNQVMRSQE